MFAGKVTEIKAGDVAGPLEKHMLDGSPVNGLGKTQRAKIEPANHAN
jgi:hypothetical protein